MTDIRPQTGENKSGFWEKLKENAASMLDHDIESLRKKTVDPAYCLIARDQLLMMARQSELQWLQHRRALLSRGGVRSRLTALGVVLESKPLLLLRLAG